MQSRPTSTSCLSLVATVTVLQNVLQNTELFGTNENKEEFMNKLDFLQQEFLKKCFSG